MDHASRSRQHEPLRAHDLGLTDVVPDCVPFAVREHPRARRVTVRVSPSFGVRVTTPPRCSTRRLASFLHAQVPWIVERLAALCAADPTTHFHNLQTARQTLPDSLHLAAIGQTWSLTHAKADHPPRLRQNAAHTLHITGHDDPAARRTLLLDWLKKTARTQLVPLTRTLARVTGLHPDRITLRAQKTRWASCSARKTVSLNCRLLFLPPHLAEYVILHELCHLTHMHHGPDFWKLLATHLPTARTLDAELDHSHHVPEYLK